MPKQFAIEKYVAKKNEWRRVFGQPELSLMFNAQEIADELDCDLSPENLACDGELRGWALQTKARFLRQVAAELKSLYPNVKSYEF